MQICFLGYSLDVVASGAGQYVQTLSVAMEREEPRFLDNNIARNEMKAYGFDITPSGVIRYSAPAGMRDDTVTARMLAWMQLYRGGIQVF